MTPLKETLEVGQAPVSQEGSRPKPDSGHLRSDAVSLDVPVKVHGSRVVEVIRGTTPHTEPFEEQTSTMIVFPLGGVLKMATQVSVGQAIVLTNLKTHQDAICRVIKTRTNPNLHSYVEVEFSHPQPGYWGVRFPSDGPEPSQKAAAPAASVPAAPARVTPAPIAAPISAPAPRVEIPRIQINEPKAAPPAPIAPAAIETAAPVAAPNSHTVQAPASTSPSISFSLDQLRGDTSGAPAVPFHAAQRVKASEPHQAEAHHETESPIEHETPAVHEPPTFGRFAASAGSGDDHAPARPAFGAGLEYSPLGTAAEKNQKEGKSWTLVAACVGLLLAAAGGGGFYFLHQRPATQRVAAIAPVAASQAAVPAPVQQAPAAAAPTTAPAPPPSAESRLRQPEPSDPGEAAPSKPVQSQLSRASESAKQNPAPAVPDMFGALNAHPSTAVRSGAAEGGAAPSIDGGALAAGSQSVALPSNSSPANLPPPPPPVAQAAPEGPLPVGGQRQGAAAAFIAGRRLS